MVIIKMNVSSKDDGRPLFQKRWKVLLQIKKKIINIYCRCLEKNQMFNVLRKLIRDGQVVFIH